MLIKIVQLNQYQVYLFNLDPNSYHDLKYKNKMDQIDRKAIKQQIQNQVFDKMMLQNQMIVNKREKYAKARKERDAKKQQQK